MEAPPSSGDVHLIGDDGDYLPAIGIRSWWNVFCIETRKLWKLGGPIALQLTCQFAASYVVGTIFVGRLGDVDLSAFTIVTNVVGVFAYGFMLGMGSALETLCGQAFGAGKVDMLGIYLQRSIIVLFFSCFLILPLYVFATPILKLIGQPNEIADRARIFSLAFIPQLFSFSIIFPTQKFLQAQSKVAVLVWIAAFVLVAEILCCWLFVNVLGWGAIGAPVAIDLMNWITAIGQFAYVVGWCGDGWRGFTWSAFNEIWAFVGLSLASAVMMCLEVWYMMIIILIAGHLDKDVTAVGSLSICLNIDALQAMLFVGINAAISVRVSNELGVGRARAAKYSVHVTIFQSLLIGILSMVIVLALRNYIALIFTNSHNMQRAVTHLTPLLGITMLLNSIQPVISGVAIGGGWQALVAYINLGSYYIFGLPLGYVLGSVAHLGVMGVWSGMIAGIALQTVLLFIVLCRTNWNKEVERARERVLKWGGQHASIENQP